MAGEREYAIKHAVTREVAYASVPKARRARLHAGFASWLERAGARLHAGCRSRHQRERVADAIACGDAGACSARRQSAQSSVGGRSTSALAASSS